VFFPDGEIGWLPFAVRAALRAHRNSGFDVVYSTASPVTAHLVAGIVKHLTGVPWVAEFRDPWLGNPVAARLPWLHRRLQVKLERWIVSSADRLVFLSPSTMRLYRRRYPGAADMVTIPNGYEPSEAMAPSTSPDRAGRYRLVWTGTLYRPGELQVFLEAVGGLVARRPDVADRLQVDFYGHVSSECAAVAGRLSGVLMGAMVRFPGFVPRHEALRAIADADAALVMLGNGPGMGQFIPGKLFEYLGQGKQVLAVLPPGDARDVLDGLGWGVIADPNVEDIGRAIERLLAQPAPARRPDPDGTYDGRRLAERLADTLRDATHGARQTQ
jgi:glycosyltransferase involved in cell wall biosynthesis